ncbi:ribonuclease H-like domain-containing protein [Tanacetum coccineum]
MAREAELKKQRVFNTGNGVAKLVWNNANRVNHANHFVPRPVQLIAVRQNVNSVRPNVNTGRANVNSVRQNVNSVRSNVNTGSFNINIVKAKQPIHTSNSNSFSPVRPQGNWGTAVKTSAGYNWRKTRPNSNCNSGSNFIRTVNAKGPQGRPKPEKAWDHLDDFEECKGGSITFGGRKGYITGKGRIRVGNLDFDSVSFVKELGHFNLFSISQICDKHHKVPRQHNMYSFDMKTPALTKDYACLIAKATSDESKLWHRRLGHINFKNLNKLVKGNLVRGLPSKVFFLATKDETNGILQNFIRQIENHLNHKAYCIKSWTKEVSTTIHEAEYLNKLQNLKTQENEAYSIGILEDTPEILAFRREFDELAPKHLRKVPKNKATSTTSINSGSGPVNTQHADQDDSDMPEITIFNKPHNGIFDEASYDDEGMVYDFNNLPIDVAVSPIPTLRIHNIHPQSQILDDPKSSVQTRSRVQQHSGAHALVSYVQKQQRNNHKDQQYCLFACFLSHRGT